MAKFASNDILRILRKFKLANTDNVPRNVEDLKKITPDEFSEIFSFKFLGAKYYLIVDGLAEDNENYILNLLKTSFGEAEGLLIENPNDDLVSFALPFQGKDVYLFKNIASHRRLDVVLSEKNPELSRSSIQKFIKNGYVKVNGKDAIKTKTLVEDGDKITMQIPDKSADSADFRIIFEDKNVIVIDKPAGVLTHSKGVLNDEFTVADFFAAHGAEFAKSTNRAGIVHRLDRDTSGIIIGAKNDLAAKKMQKQFSDRTTKKTYYAIVEGHLKQPKAIIDLPIARNSAAPSTFKVDPKGKSAQTKYEVISQSDEYSLVKLQPKTGRTHQLRVHLTYLGHPILGDKVYGNQKTAERMYLHAESLEITIPPANNSHDSQRKVFNSPLPKEFEEKMKDEQ